MSDNCGSMCRTLAACLLAAVLAAGVCGCGVTAGEPGLGSSGTNEAAVPLTFSGMTDAERQKAAESARDAVESYYRAMISDRQDFPALGLPLSETCDEYLRLRFAYDSAGFAAHHATYLNGTYTVEKIYAVQERLVCYIQAKVNYRYRGAEMDSADGDCIQVVLTDPASPTVADWYCAFPASFDSGVRNWGLRMTVPSNWLEESDMPAIREKAGQIMEDRN